MIQSIIYRLLDWRTCVAYVQYVHIDDRHKKEASKKDYQVTTVLTSPQQCMEVHERVGSQKTVQMPQHK